MRKNKSGGRAVALCPASIIYALLIIASLIFTQALRNTVSGILFVFILLLPLVSLVVGLIGRSVITVYISADAARAEKDTPVSYELRVVNTSPIPYPFVEAMVTLPQEDGVRCTSQRIYLSLAPFGGCIINKTVSFKYRGLYEIGVSDIYIGDMLRIFRFRIRVNNFNSVVVYPRLLDMRMGYEDAYTEMPSPHTPAATSELAEVFGIREYRPGDSQKTIHWKLSSKSEELQVKDYSVNHNKNVYILADLAAPSEMPEVDRRTEKKQLKKLLHERERSRVRLRDTGRLAVLDTADKITAAAGHRLSLLSRFFKKKRRRKKEEQPVTDAIDRLIEETSNLRQKKRRAEKLEKKSVRAANRNEYREEIRSALEKRRETEDEIIKRLYEQIDTVLDTESSSESDDVRSWGGAVREEFRDDMPEFCADGVVEIALSSVRRELRRGNSCTLVWHDTGSDSGWSACSASDEAELEEVFRRFCTASTVPSSKRVSELTNIISDTGSIAIKFVTSNIDPVSLSEYACAPAAFGGAGASCVCEVMLFNPDKRYTQPAARREYAAGACERLMSAGVRMTELHCEADADGTPVLCSADYQSGGRF